MRLRPLEKKDVVGILEWMKDSDVNCYFRFESETVTKESIIDFIENSMTEKNKHYAVANELDEYLGTISLKHIDLNDKNSEYAVSFRKVAIGTGASTFATKQLFRIAFEELGLNKVYLNVLSDNERAIKFYQKMGFEYEGEFKDHININGEFKNIKWYGIRRKKYEKLK